MGIFNKFLTDPNEKALKGLQPIVDQINQLESKFESFSNEQLKEKTNEFKKRLKNKESLDGILPEAFAIIREAAKRVLKQRHYDAQLIGGLVLHQGKIAEMKTGEGKTLAATLAVYLNALAEKGVHIITVNDYLSKRDANWMGPIYHLLGLTTASIEHEKAYLYEPQNVDQDEVTVEMENLKEVPRKEAYLADITYGTNNEFGFDYLRDNMAQAPEQMVQRSLYFAIIDEVDSILIDEARTPLIISAPDAESTKMYEQFSLLVPQLKENEDYNIDEKAKAATLTEEGILKVEKMLGMGNIYEEGGIRYVHHLEQALRAQVLFKRDKNYVVKNNEVIIVDDFTGRLMPGRRYSGGLHQAIEAKEKVQVKQESRTLASITFQNYFRMYQKLSGMTGTAVTSAEEFHKVYNLEAIIAPTNKPMIRKDHSDAIYKTEASKFMAVAKEVRRRHENGQPVLIGTISIEKNELLSAILQKEGVPHQLLNAKNHEKEASIIAQAGRKGAVTVATNMAGRGVDIILGGHGDNFKQEEQKEVLAAGGLHVIGTERHEARRIDDQLRGRSGRQGDAGSSQFFVSLEDDLMRVFGGDKLKGLLERFKFPDDQPIENGMISKSIESAQAKIEGFNFDLRKHVLEYDDVMNKQREIIYRKRLQALKSESLKDQTTAMIDSEVDKIVNYHTQNPNYDHWNYKEIYEILKSLFNVEKEAEEKIKEFKDKDKLKSYCFELANKAYVQKEEEINKDDEKRMRQVEKYVTLRTIDMLWMDHLDNMDHLRDSVRLRAYGQKDPLVEYKNEGHLMFKKLLDAIQTNVVGMIYKVSLSAQPQERPVQNIQYKAPPKTAGAQGSQGTNQPAKNKLGRNDPCPCGKTNPETGKPIKYKRCCYPKYGR